MAKFDPSKSDPEVWYPVPNFPAYELSSHLRVRSKHLGPHRKIRRGEARIIKAHTDDRGYKKLILWKDQKYRNLYLHRVVANLAFGPPPPGMIVRHLDDDKSNNWPSNLAYGTQTQNVADCKRNGNFVTLHGEDRGNAVMSEREVRALKSLAQYGIAKSLLAKCFGLDRHAIYCILNGHRWPLVKPVDE